MIILDTNPFLAAKYKNRPLILDGAMGSLLQQKGFISSGSSWMTEINEKSPEAVLTIHQEYIKAGADIITTNTFRTNPVALRDNDRLSSRYLVKNAVSITKEAVDNHRVSLWGVSRDLEGSGLQDYSNSGQEPRYRCVRYEKDSHDRYLWLWVC